MSVPHILLLNGIRCSVNQFANAKAVCGNRILNLPALSAKEREREDASGII
jgi:hypothetical protein